MTFIKILILIFLGSCSFAQAPSNSPAFVQTIPVYKAPGCMKLACDFNHCTYPSTRLELANECASLTDVSCLHEMCKAGRDCDRKSQFISYLHACAGLGS